MRARASPCLPWIALAVAIGGAAAAGWCEDLATGQLEIRGAILSVAPERQEVAPGLPTVVFTTLGQLDPSQIPPGLRVEGDLSGPGLDEALRLSTTPGDAFRIPGLNREGSYTLSGIRLVEGERTISAANPDSVEIFVHRLVISSITSRALTPEEMDAYGIVIDADNYTAWHYSVGFQIEGGTVEIPFDIMVGPQGMTLLEAPRSYALPVPSPDLPEVPVPTVNSGALAPPPRAQLPDLEQRDIEMLESTPIPGFIIIPTDIAFLNQFFSVIMVVQNGALAGSGLELRDLTGVLELEGDGLRQAETDPPTIPGEPVPLLDPGPDGVPGTSDDLMFIVAQASGQATWLVEGLREGHHRLAAHLSGEIHGLASGIPAPIEGTIPGVVVVRDPRFALTFFHPNVVRTGEYYDFRVSVTNTSTTPVYDLTLELPTNAISGARLVEADDDPLDGIGVGDNQPAQGVAELLPGSTGMVTWRLESRRTGRVVASAFNTSSPLDASFVFEIGVGELGVPLSPESIVLPPEVGDLPAAVVEPALELLGLAHSLANAPNGVEVDLPPVGETIVMLRGTELAAAGQRHAFGEPAARSVIGLGLEWMGAAHWSSSFDVLRRRSRRGHELESATSFHIGERMDEIGAAAATAELEELAISGRPTVYVFAEGAGFDGGARLAMVGNTSGRTAIGQWADVELFTRELDGAAVFGVDSGAWSGEIGVVAVPLDEEGGWVENSYQVQLWGVGSGAVDLEVVIVMPDGTTRRFVASATVTTGGGSLAYLNLGPEMDSTSIHSDTNGDSIQDWWEEIPVFERNAPQATVITAALDHTINPVRSGPHRNVVLLLSQPVDGEALAEVEAGGWFIESTLEIPSSDGGSETFTRDRRGRSFRLQLDPRILVATFEEPLNPHAELRLSTGLSPLPLVGGASLEISDQAIAIGEGLESGVVRGVVLGPDGGPLANATVELYEQIEICHAVEGCNWYTSLSDRVRSDTAGGFLFDAVRYRDETIPSQEAAFTVRAIDPVTGHETRLVARLPGDDRVRALTLAMVGRGDVVGTLRRADGSALDDPTVIARSITNPSEGAQAVPDESGRFRLEDLPVGPVQVVAVDGEAYTSATAQITAPGAEASVELVLQDFNQPLAGVEGLVIDGETAEPVSGLDVYVTPAGFSGPSHVATTDSGGAFSMSGVPPGVARFKAWSPTLGRYVGEVVAELLGDATTSVEMVIRPGATGAIVGTVKMVSDGGAEPLAGAYVVARKQGVFTITDDEGRYELTNLPLGRVLLETWDPVTAAAASREVDLTADGQVLVIDFTLREDGGLGSVTVNVANRNGMPEVGAEVALGWLGGDYSGLTSHDGSVRIEEVPPGTHDVLVRLGGRLARGKATVLYPGHAAETFVTLGGLRNATIRVVGDTTGDGTSVPLTPISYRVPGVKSNGTIGQVPEDGWTSCELEDDHSCRVENLPTDVGSLVAVATSGFYGPLMASEWIDDSGDHELIINFEALGVVGGRVVWAGPDGVEPVEGAIVELWTSSTTGLVPQSQYTTAEDGAFLFDLVPLGEYSLRAYHPSYGVQWLKAWISAGQVVDDLEIALRGRASIAGEVALCFDDNLLKAGSQVRIKLRPNGVPRPFISDLETDEIADGVLDLTLGEDDRASFLFADRMVGSWALVATSALHGSAHEPVYIGPSGGTATLSEPLCLHPTGSVSGRVSFPETGDPAPSVIVQLFRKASYYYEYLTTETSDENGDFVFPDVPVGREYQVRAFDTASNRGGASGTAKLCDASAPGHGTTCGLDAVLNVSLSPMGRLEGILRDQNELPVEGAHVRLRTSVILNQNGEVHGYQREWTTFTGADGGYSFDGVPSGTALVTAFAPDSPFFVEESISINPVSSPTTIADLELPPTAEVAVRVVGPLGSDIEGVEPVVAFRQSSQAYFREPSGSSPLVEHLAPGTTTSFDGVVASRYEVGACVDGCASADVDAILRHQFTTALGATAERWMSNPPSDQVVVLELVGRAAVAVTVTEGGGPVEGAVVRINGGGFYGRRDVSTQSGSDGTIIPIQGLGVGSYTVTASWNQLGGSHELEITQADHGGTIELEIGIETAGSAHGLVVDPQGLPSEGALIEMSFDNRVFQAVSDEDGAFAFPVLVAGQIYRLEAYAANGSGRHTLEDIVVNIDPVDLGVLVLDEANPWVAAVTPANGAQNADTDADIVIDFSERMRSATLTGDRIKLRRHGSGELVSAARTLEDLPDPDGEGPLEAFTRVTLSHGPLASEQLYLIDILSTVQDLAGRRPAFDFHSTFRTRDTVRPEVLGVSPSDDPEGVTPVGPDVVPIVSCSEPMDADSVNESTVQLLDSGGQLVEAVIDLQREGFDIRIRPTSALTLDTFYSIVVDGVTDSAGLALTKSFTSTFRVRDIEAPVVTLLPPHGVTVDGDTWTALEGRPLVLRAAVASNDAVKTVVLAFNGIPGAAALDASGEYRREVVAPTGVPEISASAQAEDVSGNLSDPASHTIALSDDQPPSGTLSITPPVEVLPNNIVFASAEVQDDHGLQAVFLSMTGAVAQEWTVTLTGVADTVTRGVRVPIDAVAGSQVVVSCDVEDTLGQRAPLAPATITIGEDTQAPTIVAIEPAPGIVIRSGQELRFRFALEDDVVVSSVQLEINGESVPTDIQGVAPPGSAWTAEATALWTVPEIDASVDLPWAITAIDQAGNAGSASGTVSASPAQGPEDPEVSFVCPLSGDHVAPGLQMTVYFDIEDDDQIQHYSVFVNGEARVENQAVNAISYAGEYQWTPPADAQPGEVFGIRIVARDYNGNEGLASVALSVPTGTLMTGDQELSTDFGGQNLYLAGGAFTATSTLSPQSLTLMHNATLTTPELAMLRIEGVDEVTVECSAAIDVSGRGYGPDTTHPDADPPSAGSRGGGSHLGQGGYASGAPGETYGSVVHPREFGAGGINSSGTRGGGVVIVQTGGLQVDGSIRANGVGTGEQGRTCGAGGSISIIADNLAGVGSISANGGTAWEAGYSWASESGAGGGGAIRIDSADIAPEILGNLSASSGAGGLLGGAGTQVVFGPEAVYGDLVVDGRGIDGEWTVLPVLGEGVAADGSAGTTLVTDRVEDTPEYFIDHWVKIFGADGSTEKGIWRAEQVDGVTVTLETGATVEPGDLWQGVYRFDSVAVRGKAKLRVGDLDDFGTVDVEAGSEIELVNHEPPTIDLGKIELDAYGGVFRVNGEAGAVIDPDGIGSARVVNQVGGQTTPLNIQSDGSFGGTVDGSAGDSVVLEAADRHPDPLATSAELGTLPANTDAPAIDADLIRFKLASDALGNLDTYLIGDPGSVLDLDQPVRVTLTNLSTGFVRETTATGNGYFWTTVRGKAGDPFELTATDGHPAPNSTVLDLGPLPDLYSPVIYPERIMVSVGDRLYWLSSEEPAFWDDGEIVESYVFDISQNDVHYPLEILEDGVLASSPVSAHTGAILDVIVVDGAGRQRAALLDPLPGNDGPPVVRTGNIAPTIDSGNYVIESTGGACLSKIVSNRLASSCDLPIESLDGIVKPRLENRSSPGFGPYELTITEACTGCYGFDPVAVDGIVGDEIWLVVEDDHPDWLAAEVLVWTLPPIPGAPEISLSPYQLRWVESQYLLEIHENDIDGADDPLTLEVTLWRDSGTGWSQVHSEARVMASGEALSVPLPGGEEGDLVLASATDANGLKTTVRVGYLPHRDPILVDFEDFIVYVGEDEVIATLEVELTKAPFNPVVVSYRTVAGSAVAGSDYQYNEGTVTFPEGVRGDQLIEIVILEDSVFEGDELFYVELFDPLGAELGTRISAEITIEDDDQAEVVTVPFSVAVGASNYLPGGIDVNIIGSVAYFSQPLPEVVGRGDRVEIEGGYTVFIDHCMDDSSCRVIAGDGSPAVEAHGVPVDLVSAAFGSLAEAIDGAADAEHLGTYDLVGAGRSLELVCYGDIADTTPVVIDNWVTSATNPIRIVAAEAAAGHDGSWRHDGRWSDQAYRLDVAGEDACIDVQVGHVTLQGLQLNCENSDGGVHGVQLEGIAGDVEITEILVHLGPSNSPDERIAIRAGFSLEPVNVVVRNSILWDLGDGSSPEHAGIQVDGDLINLLAANNTIFGGSYGIRVGPGSVTAINNLAAASMTASFDGDFTFESVANLASDDTAPGPPPNASGGVTVVNPTSDLDADFHLRCGVLDQELNVSTNFDSGDMNPVFDGDPGSLLTSGGVNPAIVTLDFPEDRTATGTSVVLSHWWSHDWMIEAADTVADLEPGSPSYRVLVEQRSAENEHLVWDGVTFDPPETFGAIRLTVWRNGGDDWVHINEWALDSLNPACGQGVNLSAIGSLSFADDVDSVGRTGAWDIGADQSRELEIGFVDGPSQWWEEELRARVQVMLSEPAKQAVTVRYRMEPGSADEWGDYDPTPGDVVFEPGEVSKIISIALEDDGFTSEGVDEFTVVLFDAAGARLRDWAKTIEIHEGTPPDRVTLEETLVQVGEADGVATIVVRLSEVSGVEVFGDAEAFDDTAYIGADYRGMDSVNGAPWAPYSIGPGDDVGWFEYELIDDEAAESAEGFLVRIGGAENAAVGVPSAAYIQILDDDGGSP